MKHAYLLAIIAVFSVFITTGCNTLRGSSAVKDYNANPLTVEVPPTVEAGQAQDAMIDALQGRDWTITSASPDEVSGSLKHRDFDAKVRLVREGNVIKIYSDSQYRSQKTGEYGPAVPYGWLENIQKDLRRDLARYTYGS